VEPVLTTSETDTAVEQVREYHNRTKHRTEGYAAGPETLDWTSQPNPFREFNGAPIFELPLGAETLGAPFSSLYQPDSITPQPVSIESIGALLQLSMGISAWKEYGPDKWALRCNPSSGNLHPTEAYLVSPGLPSLQAGVYHYRSQEHALEQRCLLEANHPFSDLNGLILGLSSIHWREAWKYGERAFRYCQLDLGHALGAIRYAAGVLGWNAKLIDSASSDQVANLLGLDRKEDFSSAEAEEPDLLILLTPRDKQYELPENLFEDLKVSWSGKANVLDPYPMYRWPIIDIAAEASKKPLTMPASWKRQDFGSLSSDCEKPAHSIILGRRSAQHFDGKTSITAESFYHMLDCLLPRNNTPWDIWGFEPRVHLMLFVHRVDGIEPGMYLLTRDATAPDRLRTMMRPEYLWTKPENAPGHLPLYQLMSSQCAKAAKTISCHQGIASDSCFSLGMLAEFEEVIERDPWRYRQLHWEAGLIGHVLYLEAEAAGVRGTGIGCYFDDLLHELLGIKDSRLQSLYHFTVGNPLIDTRITTLPPYPNRQPGQA
jgi:SagB-type dehydrogenase family enzyme